jgi:DNA polymerase-1
MSTRPVFYLLDGHALTYRNFFAFKKRLDMSTSKGEPTFAIFGFANLLITMLEKEKPDYLAISFDMGLSGREELFPDYKATRAAMEDAEQASFDSQLDRIQQMVRAFNIPLLVLPGYEADDIMGTVVKQAVEQGVDVKIFTGDGDILQLLDEHVKVQMFQTMGGEIEYDVALFKEKKGFEPHQLIDFKAMKGDTSDNIPGVKGIGDKTASDLLNAYQSLDGIYAHLDEIKPAVRTKLIDGREMAYLSQNLATIRDNVPVTLDLKACVSHDYNFDTVDTLFGELEFRSLRDRLMKLRGLQPSTTTDTETTAEPTESHVVSAIEVVDTVIVDDDEKLAELVKVLSSAQAITFDVESTSVDQISANLVGIALAVSGERGYYIPVGHTDGSAPRPDGQMTLDMAMQAAAETPRAPLKQLDMQKVLDAIRAPLTDPNIPKYAHNGSYDLVMLTRYGIEVTPIQFDTMIAEYVRDPVSRFLGLKALARDRLNIQMTEITELIGTGKKQITIDSVPIEQAAPYAAADAGITHRLVSVLSKEIEDRTSEDDYTPNRLPELFQRVEMPLVPVIAAIEQAGVLLDVPFLKDMSTRLAKNLAELENEIYTAAGDKFNINSPKQLNDVLFGKLGLPTAGIAKTTHGYSTAADVLDRLEPEDKTGVIKKILDYREVTKLKGTYVDALPLLVNTRTGRVHTSFNQTGSSTGRLSSSNPNLQNIPIRTEFTREIRKAFIAPPGHVLMSADYSQIELRILAHMSQDRTLLEAFLAEQDIHAATAAAVFKVPLEEVTYEQRSFAKRVNFGLLYGMGAYRLTRESGLNLAESRAFIEKYFEELPGIRQYHEDIKKRIRTHPYYIETLMGRRRYFNLFSRTDRVNANDIATTEREAINMPVQGTAADIIKLAMINLYRELQQRKFRSRMILQVHDELLLEVPEDELQDAKVLVKEMMESAFSMSVPLRANTQRGTNWCEMEKV